MVYFMTNVENKNKGISSSVASYAVCGNSAWTVTAGNINRLQSVLTGYLRIVKLLYAAPAFPNLLRLSNPLHSHI
jgi:hypothetical protein